MKPDAQQDRPTGSIDLALRARIRHRIEEGQLEGALQDLLHALEGDPSDGEFHQWAGTLLLGQSRLAEAKPHLETAVKARPGDAALWTAYATLLQRLDERPQAEAAYRRSSALEPGNPIPLLMLAQFLADAGRIPDTGPILQRVLDLSPGHPAAVSGLLGTGLYDPTRTPEELARFHRIWCETLEERVEQLPPRKLDPDPARRLKVGYLSADFRQHSCADYVEPLLRAHDRSQVHVFCYYAAPNGDARTASFKGLCDGWREVHKIGDAALADLIRQDEIDVLVDLSGHSAYNRLPLLARRPAPVQLEWLGYPFTTGLTRLDGRITDSRVDPPGSEAFASEPLLRLDPCYLCWDPPAGFPDPAPAPSLRGAPFTFGSFNHFAKINPAVVEIWATLLRRTPGSRLLLKGRGASDPVLRDRLLHGFQEKGVPSRRIEFLEFTEKATSHLALYEQVDLALDPFPYNGVTTTLEALWMGVPVLALEGRHSLARHGSAILGLLGLEPLVARNPMDYLAKGVAIASEEDQLQALRKGLRERLQASPICDAPGFARRLEGLYRQLYVRASEKASPAI